jgi:hypothetical protein
MKRTGKIAPATLSTAARPAPSKAEERELQR